MVGSLGFLERNDINYIKYEAKDACCKDKPVSFQRTIDCRSECAATFAYRNQKGLPFVGASFSEHGEIHQAHGNISQIVSKTACIARGRGNAKWHRTETVSR